MRFPFLFLEMRNKNAALMFYVMHAGRFLAQRTYKGPELRLGKDAPGVLEQGRSGIAQGTRRIGYTRICYDHRSTILDFSAG